MASMRESDTGLWLHNKLGSTDELWAPPSIASLLTASVIDNIRLCFHGLSSAVKLKLLLGMLHLPRRAVDEMKGALTEIIQLATLDSDPWVLMVADILKSFPDTGSLNLDLEEQNPNVQDILGELREKVSECETSAMLPLECQYLNKNALTTLAGPLTPPVKHFQLKRKPKSATLRAELLQKYTEVVEKQAKEETVVENATPDYAAGLVSTQKLGSLNNEPALPSTSYLPATPSVVPSSSYIPSSETQPAGSAREALQTNRQTEEPAAPNATTTLPAQFKQRTPMYNKNPCQEQGDIIQIKLSEHTEDLPKADGTGSTTMLVDTVFEMNYATGKNERLAPSSAVELNHGVFNRHLELLVLRGGLVHRPQCLQPLPTRPLPAPKWAAILPALPTGVLHQAILAPSKMQLFVCLASQDRFASKDLASTFKGPSDSRCKACRTGEYQLQRGKESCDPCPENHYCPSPDVSPVKCPSDAFCPRGSVEPTYCMELFLYKAGDSCQLTPATVIVLATFSAGGILVVFLIILRRRQEHGKRSLKWLLLPQGSGGHPTYGGTEHTEPVYAGW
ncbi:hypothetical protein DUI87_09514 [Hirundo rustica rustica]|uniref:HDAg domain-containing protein n=1 Tax=Hirundo rustica rustica TaxID=333673 RepID=A0A3M0KMD3_HIRRU|nr:hypothetical protein DUI87_09514 [Hirundo rustica rustica]